MVLKFEEYINEGLWSKGLERAQSGEKRLEDKPLPEGEYMVNDFPNYEFILDYEEDDNKLYINIYEFPIDEDSEMLCYISCVLRPGLCPQFSKKYWDENLDSNAFGKYEIVESDKFRKSLNATLKSLPKDTWTKEYFES